MIITRQADKLFVLNFDCQSKLEQNLPHHFAHLAQNNRKYFVVGQKLLKGYDII